MVHLLDALERSYGIGTNLDFVNTQRFRHGEDFVSVLVEIGQEVAAEHRVGNVDDFGAGFRPERYGLGREGFRPVAHESFHVVVRVRPECLHFGFQPAVFQRGREYPQRARVARYACARLSEPEPVCRHARYGAVHGAGHPHPECLCLNGYRPQLRRREIRRGRVCPASCEED